MAGNDRIRNDLRATNSDDYSKSRMRNSIMTVNIRKPLNFFYLWHSSNSWDLKVANTVRWERAKHKRAYIDIFVPLRDYRSDSVETVIFVEAFSTFYHKTWSPENSTNSRCRYCWCERRDDWSFISLSSSHVRSPC